MSVVAAYIKAALTGDGSTLTTAVRRAHPKQGLTKRAADIAAAECGVTAEDVNALISEKIEGRDAELGESLNLIREELRVLHNTLSPAFVRNVFTGTVHKCDGPVQTRCKWIWPAAARPFAGPIKPGLKWCRNCSVTEAEFQAWAGTSCSILGGLPDSVESV